MLTNARLRLQVSADRRYLQTEDGQPFFWLADTAWELFHKLTREEAEHYFKIRSEQGFNVVQAVALAELDGLRVPNPYGMLPLRQTEDGHYDPAQPDTREGEYDYWDHVDYIVDTAAQYGIYIAMLPTWGDKFNTMWGKGPDVFHADNAFAFGRWLGDRYKNRANLLWVLGGDRSLPERRHFDIVNGMARGITAGDEGRHIKTFHPSGASSSSHHVHHEEWLDFNMIQSGHGDAIVANYLRVKADYERQPTKPTLDAEPCYEDHPVSFNTTKGYFDEADVRKAAYYALLSGAFGHTYGHHSVWCMCPGQFESLDFDKPGAYFIMSWQEALNRPGASQMRHARTIMESRPFAQRRPDQALLVSNYEGSNYMAAARGDRYAFVYTPSGLAVNLRLGVLPGDTVGASWFNPRNGAIIGAGEYRNEGTLSLRPPTSGRGQDWLLVIDALYS